MVCSRCKIVVKSELEKLGLHPLSVDLGEVEFMEPITDAQRQHISQQLKLYGFELIDDKKAERLIRLRH